MASGSSNKEAKEEEEWVVIPRHLRGSQEVGSSKTKQRNNKIKTTKYTILKFLPKNLFEQFQRFANVYFLLIIILNWIPQVNAFGKEIAMIPLIFVLSVTALKDLFEDRRRYLSDKEVNGRPCKVGSCEQESFHDKIWQDIEVGDKVKVENNAIVPADMILLESSDRNGIAHVSTASLDGETNLKQKQVVTDAAKKNSGPLNPKKLLRVTCEMPNNRIHDFSGYILVDDGSKISVNRNNLLLRGCLVKNTDSVTGIVVYAGHDTKAMLNNTGPRNKRSKLEKDLNKDVIACVAILILFCTIGGIGCGFWTSKYSFFDRNFTPGGRTDQPGIEGLIRFWSFVIILQVIIPISLYVSVEIVKLGQVFFMNQDVEMFHPNSVRYPLCRATNINEDLGQIQYVFSDKTGTLTENLMIFKKFSVSGKRFRIPDENGNEITQLKPRCLDSLESAVEDFGVELRDEWKEFFMALACCNTVVVGRESKDKSPEVKQNGLGALRNPSFDHEESSNHDSYLFGIHGTYRKRESVKAKPAPEVKLPYQYDNPALDESLESISQRHINCDLPVYEAESPDEGALVKAAFLYGFELISRSMNTLVVHTMENGDTSIRVLNVLAFTSARKRMSVILEYPDGRIVLYCKGADTIILNRLAAHQDKIIEKTEADLEHYSKEGLRTLCVAKRDLSITEYREWADGHHEAEIAIADRDEKIAESADAIETELILLGATGIEDKLQDGVPETIASLREANIKVWVLTGDKQETAINVAFSCRLLDNKMDIIVLNTKTNEECKEQLEMHLQRLRSRGPVVQVSPSRENVDDSLPPLALVIDGGTLTFAVEKPLDKMFVELAAQCESVVCCRAAPIQKSRVVHLIRRSLSVMCLAIGDGANDVSMLQTADIGVGIAGQEGMQAVMASDFVLGRFRFLKRLLLLHGTWCYDRTGRMIVYFFYKNAMFVSVLFWYQLYNGFSGSNAVDDLSLIFFNLLFTSAPPIVSGIWDQIAPADELLTNHRMYKRGQKDKVYTRKIFWLAMLDALYQSLILFFMPFMVFKDSSTNMAEAGILYHQTAVWTASLQLAIEIPNWTVVHHFFLWGSVILSYVWYMVFCAIQPTSTMYWAFYHAVSSAEFWMLSFLTPILALLPRFLYRSLQCSIAPTDVQRARMCAKLKKSWSQQSLKNFGNNSFNAAKRVRQDSGDSVLS